MANDVHYIIVFVTFFLLLGLVCPLLNAEFNSDLTEEDVSGQEPQDSGVGVTTAGEVILNLFTIPFWTFGLPAWVNLWFLLPFRLAFFFVIARNVWVGGGG